MIGTLSSFSMDSVLYFRKHTKIYNHIFCLEIYNFVSFQYLNTKSPLLSSNTNGIHILEDWTMDVLHEECCVLTPEILIYSP